MVGLLFGKRYPKTRIGLIELDATVSESHDFTSNVTNYPLETGATVTDHIYNNPIHLSLDCLITDSPISNNLLTSLNPFRPLQSFVTSFGNSPVRSNAVFDELMQLYKKREILRVVTGLKTYDNMAITSLTFPRTTQTGRALNFRVDLVQLTFASTTNLPIQYARYVKREGDLIRREQVASNETYPNFQNDPPDSFADQLESARDTGRQTTQPPNDEILSLLQDANSRIQFIYVPIATGVV